ncbi:tRNA pseudouridine(54/55) synthase Pus10 [Nitrosopumilus sp.]|uniref:tRNA pseudouridine(54/55) synthase Pus10 n=1 Tax=Nitrosopumilus sp. TaxID=2024843 RepID=UPI00261AA44A|nr:tRNA pseudouridine(54/55) synthase Pus10 [Nitrosopumilus sp.]
MSEYAQIITIANQILKKHDLCDQCLGRLFAKKLHLSSNKLLGKKLNKKQKTSKCYICKNLFDNLHYYLNMMIDSSSNFSFTSFSVGAILKPSIIDRDDAIRSKYKLRGIDSVKTDITKQLAKLYSKNTKKILDSLDSDVTFTVNTKDEYCQLRSKSIFLSGRYTKNNRNLSQKQKSCSNCSGKGCRVCDFHGINEFDSVEGIISELLFKKIGCTTAKFTWVGGEDKSSLVLGTGRPFFVKLQNPQRRQFRAISKKHNSVSIMNLKIETKLPSQPIKFSSKIDILISADSKLSAPQLKKMKSFSSSPITVYEKSGKQTEKKINSVSYKKLSDQKFKLKIDAEGGLPIKRFVNGDDVVPSVSSILKMNCKVDEFDFLDVKINDNN